MASIIQRKVGGLFVEQKEQSVFIAKLSNYEGGQGRDKAISNIDHTLSFVPSPSSAALTSAENSSMVNGGMNKSRFSEFHGV